MKYNSHTKCRFISKEFVIFDVTIYREYYLQEKSDIACKINVIINEEMIYDEDVIIQTTPDFDNIEAIQLEVRNAVERCCKRAKRIFNKYKKEN